MDKRNTKFRIIARRVAGLLNVDEMYVYMWLLFKSGFDTGESHIKRGTLCECTGFKDKDTITGYTNKFRDLGLLKKHGNNFIEANVWKTANEYILAIPQIDWIRINYGLLEENIPRELKSFLVLLKCLCLNNTNICLYNYKQIGEKLNINRNTVSKYTKQCIELGKIKDLESGFLITDNNIIADPRKDGLSVNAKYT
ncbi:MAG: hypothetical protein LUH22_17135, partial [Bacteroides sp.]|nr:hypothetical protein [Bacteroides sp.]